MAKNIREGQQIWLKTLGKKGQEHKDSKVRVVYLPPQKSITGWDVNEYRDRWDLLEEKLKA